MQFRKPVMTISLPEYLSRGNTSLMRTEGSVDSSTEIDETTFCNPPAPPRTFACRREGSFNRSDTVTLTLRLLFRSPVLECMQERRRSNESKFASILAAGEKNGKRKAPCGNAAASAAASRGAVFDRGPEGG